MNAAAPLTVVDAEELSLFRDNVVRFLKDNVEPHYEKWEKAGIFPKELYLELGAAGLLCVDLPEAYGGAGAPFEFSMVVLEEAARMGFLALASNLSVHSDIAAPYILHLGTEAQRQKYLPRMVSGECIGAIGMSEPGAGSDLQGMKTSAIDDGNGGYVINGSKTFITNGQTANLICVVAKTDRTQGAKGVSLLFVETDEAEGFERGRNLSKLGQPAQDTSELFFNEVKVPTENLLGTEEGQGFYQLMQQLPQERLNIAVQGMATIERALALTIDYVKQRQAFGKRILDFQNTQFVLAECKTEATVAKVFVDNCMGRHLKGKLDAATASMAKYWVSDMEGKIVDRCLQLFGGYGFMDEYPISRMYRDSRIQRIYGGTNEIMKVLIARTL